MKYIVGFLAIGLLLGAVSLSVGPSGFTFLELINASENTTQYIFDLRLHRTLASFLVGAALAITGLLLQSYFRNPLAEPYTLGLSGGATLGAVLGVILNLSFVSISLFSFLGCCLAGALVLFFSKRSGSNKTNSTILFGVMLSFFCGAIVTFISGILEPGRLFKVYSWLIGQFGGPNDMYWPILFVVVSFALIWARLRQRDLDGLLLDSSFESFFKTSSQRLQLELIVVVTLLTAISVSISGLIGFVGIVTPHVAKFLIGSARHKVALPLAGVVGGCFLLSADLLGRAINLESEIPAGGITAIVGSPILFFLLMRSMRSQHA